MATHPGLILADELKSRKIKQVDLAERVGLYKTQLNEIMKGKRCMTPELALQLDWFFIGTATYWMNAQIEYDLEKAENIYTNKTMTDTQRTALFKKRDELIASLNYADDDEDEAETIKRQIGEINDTLEGGEYKPD